jgi:hypothetical protein
VTTEKQLLANRANAKLSTGPRTADGKARSRANAWKHGLSAKEVITEGEKCSEFEDFRAELWHQFQPALGLESVLLDRLAVQAWRLRRPAIFEAACRPFHDSDLDWKMLNNLQKIALVSRYETALMNNFHRTLQQFLAVQDRPGMQKEDSIEVLPEPEERNAA